MEFEGKMWIDTTGRSYGAGVCVVIFSINRSSRLDFKITQLRDGSITQWNLQRNSGATSNIVSMIAVLGRFLETDPTNHKI